MADDPALDPAFLVKLEADLDHLAATDPKVHFAQERFDQYVEDEGWRLEHHVERKRFPRG
jgi:hypothetical protein